MRLFNKKQLEIIKFSSTDPSRQALYGLLFDGNKTVATDGHRLVYVESEPEEGVEWQANGVEWSENDKPFIVHRPTIEKALKNIPKKPDLPVLENAAIGLKVVPTGHPDKVICQTTDLDNTENVEARTVDSKFPSYEQVIPDFKNPDQYQRVGVNARYLKEVCMLLEKYEEKDHCITLYLKKDGMDEENGIKKLGEHLSMVVTADDGKGTTATAILMPVRL